MLKDDDYFSGRVERITTFDIVLTAEEILALATDDLSALPDHSRLIRYWPLLNQDEEVGSVDARKA